LSLIDITCGDCGAHFRLDRALLVLFRFEWVNDLTHCKLSVATGHGGIDDGRESTLCFGTGADPAVVH